MNDHRPRWFRPRNVLMASGLILVGLTFYAVAWAYTAEPEPTVDYGQRMEAFTARAQPRGENAWPYLVEAAGIMEAVQAEFAEEGLDYDDLSPEGLVIVRRAIAELEARGAFGQLARAALCPNAVHPRPSLDEESLLSSTMPELGHLRTLAKARVASMEMALADGAHADAVEAFDQVLVIAWACTHQATLIEQLVGWSVASLALERLRYAVIEQPMEAPTLRRFLERIHARTPLGHPALGLEGERLAFLDVVQRTHSDNGRGNGRVIATAAGKFVDTTGYGPPGQPSGDSPRIINLLGFILPTRKDLTEKANAYYDDMVRRSRLSYSRRHAETTDPYAYVEELGPRYFLLTMLVPAVGRFLDRGDVTQCIVDGSSLQLAIEGYRAEHGSYPATLESLIPEWIDQVPGDPFSVSPFVYRLVSGDEHGRRYLLYSVGADGLDHDAAANPEEPLTALTRKGIGQDFVFNQPRPPAEPY
ncbi:MAG: hypothetical protein ACYTGT_11170 [Planctomycetota bacterium]